MLRCLHAPSTVALLLAVASASSALTFTINASDSGWHNNFGNHADAANENYTAGWSSNEELRNFFVFDLSGIPVDGDRAVGDAAALQPGSGEPDVTYTGGYESPDATETYTVREILLPAATVTRPPRSLPPLHGDRARHSVRQLRREPRRERPDDRHRD